MRTWILRTNVIFDLLVKESNSISISFMVWDTIVFFELWKGCLGAFYGRGLQWASRPKVGTKIAHSKLYIK